MEKIPPRHMIELENPTATTTSAPQHTHWVSRHPFTASILATGALFILGTSVVIQHLAASPVTPHINAWGTDLPLNPYDTIAGLVTVNRGDIMHPVPDNSIYTIPDLTGNPAPPPPDKNTNSDTFDYVKFLGTIGQPKPNATSSGKGVTDISYAFPPLTLFVAPKPATDRTAVQQALYTYGNEVGSYIQSYEQQYPDQTRQLKDQIEDPTNPDKIQAVVQMGHNLSAIGTNLLSMEQVPSQVKNAHIKLAQSYKKIGENLALVPQAQGSAAMMSAITTYNASADVFAKDFASLVSNFSTYGVTFNTDDAGSVFTFTYSSGM